jgi:glycosyltransferase involved in cell wall biosynthesis
VAFQLLAITDPGCSVSTRYRLEQYRSCLETLQIDLRIQDWPRNRARRSDLWSTASIADAVLFQRILPSIRLIRWFRKAAKRMIYDFDDAVIYLESSHRRTRLLPERWLRFRTMVRSCDEVTAGNDYLAALARRRTRRPVHVLPTTVDVGRYDREPGAQDCPRVLGWIGARSTLPYLERLREPLEILSRNDGVTVRVIADQTACRLQGVNLEWIRWDQATEVRELKRLCVGLAPLPDDRWTKGKCGLRLLQYLAAGVPSVASPVGVQGDLSSQGAALAASRTGDWVAAVRSLLSDRALSDRLAANGGQVVERRFDAAKWAPQAAGIWCGMDFASR